MGIWSRITETLSALASGQTLADVLDWLRPQQRRTPERSIAFTIAVIALGAKLAKADGQVTRGEVRAFREVFQIAPDEEANAARVFDLARQDVAGFDSYARRIAAMFPPGDPVLIDLMEGLFHVALADGVYHQGERDYLHEVSRIFGLTDRCFSSIRARYVPDAPRDPHDVLGVDPGAPLDEIRAAWRRAVKENHPDQMLARGVPEEALELAGRRMADINRAWEEIRNARSPSPGQGNPGEGERSARV